jgi:competence protein ComEA
VIILTIAFVAFSAGFLSGRMTSGGTFTISAESGGGDAASAFADAGAAPSAAGTAAVPSAGKAGAPAEPQPSGAGNPEASDAPEKEVNFPININACGEDELIELPSIGATRAEAIVDYREEFGPFRSKADIMLVPGIGESIYDDIKDYITAGDAQ